MTRQRSGFTLIELVIVILIMAIMSGFAALSLRSHIDRARWTRCFEQLEYFDRIGRIAARSESTPYRLSFHRAKRRIELRAIGSNASRKSYREWKLPNGVQFSGFRDRASSSRSEELSIEINPNGQSRSYAVAIKANTGPREWFVTLGLSGQHIRMENSDDVVAMFPR
jgi:prepilin-type N-terminal cleavage/methylation domain-containing protein